MAYGDNLKKKADKLFPWEDENKKRKPERMDSIPPRTSMKAKVRSKTPIPGQEYLELYLMIKEKERLEKFGKVMGKIQLETSDRWRDIRKAVRKAEMDLPSASEVEGVTKEEVTRKEKPRVEAPKRMKKVDWSF
ncbi:MAG: hypothetical protein SCARUB_00554 [Candidatus Scalindua rubra]|uniref:Uncharacterized protein n=1 Tax=Candidatus Scalindua rubra TaxID=1872076 RepID=A0A1E3XF87_9BACT|nr:MAG: hypothetical protein SCARUB_00554 [Candidatus Scalindua rubra]